MISKTLKALLNLRNQKTPQNTNYIDEINRNMSEMKSTLNHVTDLKNFKSEARRINQEHEIRESLSQNNRKVSSMSTLNRIMEENHKDGEPSLSNIMQELTTLKKHIQECLPKT